VGSGRGCFGEAGGGGGKLTGLPKGATWKGGARRRGKTHERYSFMSEFPEFGRHAEKKYRRVEVFVFLFLIISSSIISFLILRHARLGFRLVAFSSIVNDLALLSLVLYLAWRNGESFKELGWDFGNVWHEMLIGTLLFIPLFLGLMLFNALIKPWFSVQKSTLPSFLVVRGALDSVLAFFLVLVVAVVEETIYRGYLILRLKALFGKADVAVVVSAIVFMLGHGYEGIAGMITVGIMGIIFGVVYLWRGSLAAPMVMHFLMDFIVIDIFR
jgi:membrane protease YdiL (CAAX protease family)